MTNKRIHYLSGIILSVFIAMHLLNHLYSIFGVEKHISLMNNLRFIYRNTFVETILLAAVVTQMITGVTLFLKRKATVNTFFEKLQIWSGLYLSAFFSDSCGCCYGWAVCLKLRHKLLLWCCRYQFVSG